MHWRKRFVRKVIGTSWVNYAGLVAGVTGVGFGGFYYMERHSQKKIRNSPVYREALEIFQAHEQAKEALGTPVQLLDIDLSRRNENFCVPGFCKFTVPLIGQKDAGSLYVRALPTTSKIDSKTETEDERNEDGMIRDFDNSKLEIAQLNLYLEGEGRLVRIYEIDGRKEEVQELEEMTLVQSRERIRELRDRERERKEERTQERVKKFVNPDLKWLAERAQNK